MARGSSKATKARLEKMLDEAERGQRFLVSTSYADTRALRRLGSQSLVAEPQPGIFVRRDCLERLKPPDRALRLIRALAAKHPGWIFCGVSAALIHGLPVSWHLLDTTHVAAGPSAKPRMHMGIAFHAISNLEAETVHGLRVTPLLRTVFDCAAHLEFPDALAVMDGALRAKRKTSAQLCAEIRSEFRGHRGIARALRITMLADGRAESGGESIARALLLSYGYVPPELQVHLADPGLPGHELRCDMGYIATDGVPIFIEVDGKEKSENPEMTDGLDTRRVLQRERMRESRLTIYGARILRLSFADLMNRRHLTKLLDDFRVPKRPSGSPISAYYAHSATYSAYAVHNGWGVLETTYEANMPLALAS